MRSRTDRAVHAAVSHLHSSNGYSLVIISRTVLHIATSKQAITAQKNVR